MERAEVLRERLHTTGIRLHLFTEGMFLTARLLFILQNLLISYF